MLGGSKPDLLVSGITMGEYRINVLYVVHERCCRGCMEGILASFQFDDHAAMRISVSKTDHPKCHGDT